MTQRELIYIKTAADEKSISQAAKKLYIAQPSMSQFIKRIEDGLGTSLFNRTPNGLTLTYAGEKYYQMALQVLKLYDNFEMDLSAVNDMQAGRIHLGITSHLGTVVLPKILPGFMERYPSIEITVTEDTSDRLEALLAAGQVDFIITNYPNSGLSNSQNVRVINEFHDVFVANQEYFPLKGETVSLQKLQTYPILMLDRKSTTSEFLHHMFQREQLDLVPEIELSSNDLLIDLASIGLGIAFIPDYCLPRKSDSLFIVETSEELPSRELVIAYNEQIPASKATLEFLNFFPGAKAS